jgi:hypothetical protein
MKLNNYFDFLKFLIGFNKPTNLYPITEINTTMYIGRWYQVYGAPTNVVFQGFGKCITADYGILQNGNISVLNSQLNLKNNLEQISGYAYYKNISEPGKFTVHLDDVPVDAPYWIVKLGEIIDNQYQYSIITTPSGFSNWILTRNITRFYELYDKEVKEYLYTNAYNWVTIDQDNCIYSNLPNCIYSNLPDCIYSNLPDLEQIKY